MSSYFVRRALAAYGGSNGFADAPPLNRIVGNGIDADVLKVDKTASRPADPTAYIVALQDAGTSVGVEKSRR